jgi:hypothetical protein
LIPLRLLFIALLVVFACEEEEKDNSYVDCTGIDNGENICGCMDNSASNFNPDATVDDGSCIFHFSLKDLNPNSSTVEQILSPSDFLGDICIVFFGHES